MTGFYHSLVTEKSWKTLQSLRKDYDFILIGGWAVFLWTHALKSKDIDLVVEYEELEKFKRDFEVSKNDRLKKYEARKEEVEIDIYVPFYSNPGLPAETLKDFVVSLEGFDTLKKEVLAVLKQRALVERRESVKGRKDMIDLVSLLRMEDFDWKLYKNLVKKFGLVKDQKNVYGVIKATTRIEELDLNVHKMAKFKKLILPQML